MKVSEYIVAFLVENGVHHVFQMAGGSIASLLDAAHRHEQMECVSVRHEQAAAFAAEGYARINQQLGVAMATSGPGALNLLTGIGSCYFDSVPCLFLTGQVNTYEFKHHDPVRQRGFQETEIVRIVRPIVKYAEMVTDPSLIRYHLEKAVFLAQTGRPGPVLLDIPMDIQRAEIDPDRLKRFERGSEKSRRIDDKTMEQVILQLKSSRKPLILAGGGIRTAGVVTAFRQFVDETRIPVVASLMGLDALPHDHPSFVGLIGAYGHRYANFAIADCDLLIVLGSRLDSRQTGTRPETFARRAVKIHVDVDANELNHRVRADITIHSDLHGFFSTFQCPPLPDLSAWHKRILQWKHRFPPGLSSRETICPNTFMERLSMHSTETDIVCLDVGQHQMWASQSFHLKKGQRLLQSGGMGAMGFAIPAAIGASKAGSGPRVIVIAGDGGMQVNIQELSTIAFHRLPIKIFVMNNRHLGMIRMFQDIYFEGRQTASVDGYDCPDFVRVAKAYDIPAFEIADRSQADSVIQSALAMEGPVLVNVILSQHTTVVPKLLVNRPVEDMYPLLDRKELEEILKADKGDGVG